MSDLTGLQLKDVIPRLITLPDAHSALDGIEGPTGIDVTDLIIDSGSNSDGEWWKFADGTLVQWNTSFSFTKDINSAAAGGFRNSGGDVAIFTAPVTFVDGNFIYYCISNNDTSGVQFRRNTRSSQTADVLMWRPDSQASVSINVSILMIGRWK